MTVWTKWTAVGKWLIAAMLCSSAVVNAQNFVNGDSVYHSVCTNCHNSNPNLASGSFPAPAGASDTLIQSEINANMGSPYTDSYHTASSATINATVRDVGAYLRNLNYPVLQLGGNTSFNFGSILTTQTATTTFTIRNNKSGADNLVISSITPSSGAIRASQNCVGAIAANTTCTVTVTFDPPSAGSFSTSFTINASNALPASTATGTFSGSATVPTAGFSRSPATLTLVGRFSPLQADSGVVTISNPGGATANLILTSLPFSGTAGVFGRSGTCVTGGGGMAPGGSCTVIVTYTPSAIGPQNGTLTINHNAPGSPSTVTLTATGTQSLISPTSSTLNFGNVQQGVPKPLNLVVSNTGTATLNFTVSPSSPAAKTGAAASDYLVTGNCLLGSSLAASSGTCTLTVTLTPTALGARPATLTISSDATNGPLVITLSGNGVALPEPVVTPPASDFPDTVINQTSAQTRTVTIQNDRVRNVTYSVSDTADFKVGTESCAGRIVTGGGGICTIQIRFIPTLGAGEGRRTASLPITFTGVAPDPDPSTVNVDVAGNALLPLAQSATTLNAAAVVGSPTTTSMLLTNRSSSAITLATLAFSGAAASDYSLAAGNTCMPALVLAPSTSCTLVVGFNPPTAGTRNATLTISHSAAGSPQTVAFLGTATPAPQGRIELSSSALTYADTQLASTSAQTITVHNGGNLGLNFSGFTLGGANPGDYLRSGTCAVGTPLPIAADCTVILTFGPTALGLRTAILSIASDASNGTAVITLSGTGVPIPAPQVSLTPTTLDFGTQTIGGLYPARRIRLANSGTADLTVASVTASGTGFAIASSACPSVLAAGAGCNVDIAFTPVAAQAYVGALTVVSNAAGSPHATVLRGTGSAAAVPVLVFSPATTSLDFGSVSAGSVSAAQTVTVLNQGPGGATLTLLNAVGGDASSFSVVGGTCAIGLSLFEGTSCTIGIQFAPGSSGTKTAAVQIASTGSFPPVLTLTGVGLAGPNPSLALSASALAFESTRIGSQSLPSTLRISSSGSGVVTVSAINVTGTYGIDSSTCPALPFTLPAGTDCTVAVSFRPITQGAAPGTLSITSDAAPAVREVALSGSGDPTADTSSGGCTIGDPASPADPLLWTMVLLAAGWLVQRQRQRKRAATRTQPRREPLN